MQVPKRKSEQLVKHVAQDNFITQEKYDEFQAKLIKNRDVKRPRLIEEVQRLAQEGDFSENVPYQMAKGRLRGLNNRIMRLEDRLTHAQIITADRDSDIIQVGHTVTVEINGKQRDFQILGSVESDPSAGIISRNSPIGEALVGTRVGQDIEIVLANGKTVIYKVISIK